MKQQIITGLKKPILLVEIDGELSDEFIQIMNEHGMAEIIGKLTDIKEEQFKKWVEIKYDLRYADRYDMEGYRDYGELHSDGKPYWFHTAKESFFSKLKADGVVFENKMLEPGSAPIYTHSEKYIEDYKEAQSKVWDINRTYLFQLLK